jgi:hypothetical protein
MKKHTSHIKHEKQKQIGTQWPYLSTTWAEGYKTEIGNQSQISRFAEMATGHKRNLQPVTVL